MAMGGGMVSMGPSVSYRPEALERQIHQVLQRLDRLEGQWKSLDRRIGRGSGEPYPEPLYYES
jgi:hypothetical protein